MSLTPLSQSILRTLSYFDNFKLPLTKEELYRYLWQSPRIGFEQFLLELNKEGLPFENESGFYFLSGQKDLVENRRKLTINSDRFLLKARQAADKLRYVPFIKAIFVCNTVAMNTASNNSDIDFFIVVKSGRIWLTRFFTTLILTIFGLRRTKRAIKNKICLSFYTTENNLDLKKIALAEADIYLLYWICFLVPLYDPENISVKIWRVNSAWIQKFIPNIMALLGAPVLYSVKDSRISRTIKKMLEAFWSGVYGNIMEQQAKGAQQAKMKFNVYSLQNAPDTRVIISDNMLKFHENDRRQFYFDQWLAKVRALGL